MGRTIHVVQKAKCENRVAADLLFPCEDAVKQTSSGLVKAYQACSSLDAILQTDTPWPGFKTDATIARE